MNVFCHHIYEYKKGLRNLVLHTAPCSEREKIEGSLQREGLAYLICRNGNNGINVFFGKPTCVEVVKDFNFCSLCELTDEQDFILGIMLGYDRLRQCDRYLARKTKPETVEDLIG